MTATSPETATGASVRRRSATVSPEYGTVGAILSYVVGYAFVDAMTPLALDALPTDLAPLAGTAFAALLWLGLVGTVLTELERQLSANPHRFDGERERRSFLLDRRPSRPWLAVALAGAVLGGGVAWTGWVDAVETAATLVVALATFAVEDVVALGPVTVATFVLFWVGLGFVTYGVDRAVVGTLRELQFRLVG